MIIKKTKRGKNTNTARQSVKIPRIAPPKMAKKNSCLSLNVTIKYIKETSKKSVSDSDHIQPANPEIVGSRANSIPDKKATEDEKYRLATR